MDDSGFVSSFYELQREIDSMSVSLEQDGINDDAEALLLSNRGQAFNKLCTIIVGRSAAASERSALNGVDPLRIAQFAEKDAERLIKLRPDDPSGYIIRGDALLAMEKYSDAKNDFSNALRIDPNNAQESKVRASLTKIDNILENTESKSTKYDKESMNDIDDHNCSLCFKLLYEPVTTSCGHSFCQGCLMRSMDYSNRCPACRTILFLSPGNCNVSVTLRNILMHLFKDEYEMRRKEVQQEEQTTVSALGSNCEVKIPLFVMDSIMPQQRIALNIFEPRYRLLIRRAMNSSRSFGMIGISRHTGEVDEIGCEVDIVECDCLPDGRFYIEVEGKRRFRVSSLSDQDGYRLAQARYVCDARIWDERSDDEQGVIELKKLFDLTVEVSEMTTSWISSFQSQAGRTEGQRRMRSIISRAGHAPQPPSSALPVVSDDQSNEVVAPTSSAVVQEYMQWCENVSFWVANLLSLINYCQADDMIKILSTEERLQQLSSILKNPSHRETCCVQ